MELPNGFHLSQIASTLTPSIQELIILPTEKCNLRCTYCYEDFAIGKMSEATQRGVENFIENRISGLRSLRLSWFGGEPLVAKDVVLRISSHAKRLSDQHGVRLLGGLTTNAYLLDLPLFNSLLDYDQDFFQVTLDGWGEAHDAVRKFADGRGSFAKIWDNLVALKTVERKFEICIRVHVRRDNLDGLPLLMERLGRAFGGDDRFRLDFQHLRDLGGPGGKTIIDGVNLSEIPAIDSRMRAIFRANSLPQIEGADDQAAAGDNSRSDAITEALEAGKAAGESAGSQRAEDLLLGNNYICYAAKANSLLIRANGRVGKCTVALNDDRNDIGSLNEDGTVAIDNSKLKPWLRGLDDFNVDTLGCPLHNLPIARSHEESVERKTEHV